MLGLGSSHFWYSGGPCSIFGSIYAETWFLKWDFNGINLCVRCLLRDKYFEQLLGAEHSKCSSKYFFLHFLHTKCKKEEKGNMRQRTGYCLILPQCLLFSSWFFNCMQKVVTYVPLSWSFGLKKPKYTIWRAGIGVEFNANDFYSLLL